jgi:hypothetical protein
MRNPVERPVIVAAPHWLVRIGTIPIPRVVIPLVAPNSEAVISP